VQHDVGRRGRGAVAGDQPRAGRLRAPPPRGRQRRRADDPAGVEADGGQPRLDERLDARRVLDELGRTRAGTRGVGRAEDEDAVGLGRQVEHLAVQRQRPGVQLGRAVLQRSCSTPLLRPLAPAATPERSTTVTCAPASARNAAALQPMIPAPTTVTSIASAARREGENRRQAILPAYIAPWGDLGDVAELLGLRERLQLLERLVLDLADPLARHVERAADLVERAGVLAAQAVAQLEDAALAVGEVLQRLAQRLLREDLGGALVRRLGALVGDELAELGLLLVADRLLERDRRLRGALDRVDLLGVDPGDLGDLLVGGLAAELGDELALGAADLVELLDDVDRDADRARLVGERAGDRLADPPGRVRGELEALAVVELLRARTRPSVPSWMRSRNGRPWLR
jgi:hypothetical protein